MKAHHEVNKPIADRVLANIQNGIVPRVKGEQIQHKKALEAGEEFHYKYHNFFRKEAEKTTMFMQMNLEKMVFEASEQQKNNELTKLQIAIITRN